LNNLGSVTVGTDSFWQTVPVRRATDWKH